ncbi:MAG: 1-(5-phosphoribosyl)-5-[(5-phosphoribosylamino)methylideneamino]imidazole-4-carboxamide isomerase [Oscillospiraceae bacterium]|jgi:phosphoribosylformimino-5-aminoimidazole carboxamide ribotide isomerase|nr:1-(5-phosphoribosyl)-5-[(5-phosphoribosylamino)methylideneamino]imidazole-4-carboxamide isomerase [Oscillospiraceae bacterium]
MKLFPAIDLHGGRAVRLVRGDYAQMTVYNENTVAQAEIFRAAGAEFLHVVDLEGAKSGETPNFATVRDLIERSGLKVEVGGGIRDAGTVGRYLDAGAFRVILGTAAVQNPEFLRETARKHGGKIAVGVDIRDGFVAVKGWTELSDRTAADFCRELEQTGIATVICTDISKDGLLSGANLDLYREMSATLGLDIIASGGVSSLGDVRALRDIGLYGAILGKALYTGAIDLAEAIKITEG